MRADRLISIMLLLQTRGKLTAETLANELEVSRRTIQRDITDMSAAGIPIYADSGHGGGFALDEGYRVSLTGLKEAEVRALFLSSSARLLEDLGMGEAADNAHLKLSAALPGPSKQVVDHVRQRFHIDPVWWYGPRSLPCLAVLKSAVEEDRRVQVLYEHRDGEVVERVLEPYGLVAKSSIWYLVALREGSLRVYRVSRFLQATMLDDRFNRNAAFDLATYWEDHAREFRTRLVPFTFTLRVRNDLLNFVKWHLPGTYQVLTSSETDDWFTARFETESMASARMFVLGLGAGAVVLEPGELDAAVLEQARAVIDQRHHL
jgi:predicted DNA-binding transcriptional regulator YafY